ncbi:MAG: endonuclease/exonuclease/phosphatase family protein [Actinomycetota bacterium]|nr:endonuclease/exonuclease/phosphatase family protein [Actinomycetota bacterium]
MQDNLTGRDRRDDRYRSLTVATYNIHHGAGLDDAVDLDRIADVVCSTGAEIVGLQELDEGLGRSGRSDQARYLARKLGREIAFFPTLERHGGRYGIGILTSSAVEAHFERLPRRGTEEPRGAIVAQSGALWIVVTHLSRDRFSRTSQTRALASLVADLDGPVLVMGDFNQGLGALGPLLEVGLTSDGLFHRTLGRAGWRRRGRHIDHILVGGGAVIRRSWTVESDASDHVPLAAEVEIP